MSEADSSWLTFLQDARQLASRPVPLHASGTLTRVTGLTLEASGLNLPEGTPLEIMIDGQKIGEMTLQGKLARFERDSEKGEYVPPVEADQVLQVLFRGEVIAQGKYYAE